MKTAALVAGGATFGLLAVYTAAPAWLAALCGIAIYAAARAVTR